MLNSFCIELNCRKEWENWSFFYFDFVRLLVFWEVLREEDFLSAEDFEGLEEVFLFQVT